MVLISFMCPYPFYPTNHHQLHAPPCSITTPFFTQALPSTSGKGSLKDVCDDILEMKAIETKMNQTKPKNENLKDSKLDGRCNAQSIGILRSTLVIG